MCGALELEGSQESPTLMFNVRPGPPIDLVRSPWRASQFPAAHVPDLFFFGEPIRQMEFLVSKIPTLRIKHFFLLLYEVSCFGGCKGRWDSFDPETLFMGTRRTTMRRIIKAN